MRSPPRVVPEDPHHHLDLSMPLGRGGTGTVWRAHLSWPHGAGREVAAKLSHGPGTQDGHRRIRELSWKLAMVRHRAMVPIDACLPLRDARWVLITDLVQGVDLARLRGIGPVPLGAALAIVGEVADLLDVAWRWPDATGHPLHLLHRDLKPANIMLTAAGEVRVLDFGVAHAQVPWHESSGSDSRVWGTLAYMAPERLEGGEGPEGEVYALAAILVELVSGHPVGTTSTRPAEHAERVRIAAERFAAAGASPVAVELVTRMLDFDPRMRPETTEAAEALGRLRAEQGGIALAEWAPSAVAEARHRSLPLRLPSQSRARRVPRPEIVLPRREHSAGPPWRRALALILAGGALVLGVNAALHLLNERADSPPPPSGTLVDIRGR